ncbi:MAG: hypothetical protein GYA34_08380 [Chloroflexi bacterium]|nr:hypothetical protein [Chloroflexota bacterium]
MTKIITALKVQSKNRNRINVFLDGQFAFGLSRIVAAWLKVGQELTDEKITSLLADDELESAYQRALNFISIRDRSSAEIRQFLSKHNTPHHLIDETLKRMKGNHLLDDINFAQTWIENRSEFKPRSRRALSLELHHKGIPQEIIEQSLERIDEEELALRAAQKFARKYSHLDWIEFRKKMLGLLARRGFTYELSSRVISQVWKEVNSLELS